MKFYGARRKKISSFVKIPENSQTKVGSPREIKKTEVGEVPEKFFLGLPLAILGEKI